MRKKSKVEEGKYQHKENTNNNTKSELLHKTSALENKNLVPIALEQIVYQRSFELAVSSSSTVEKALTLEIGWIVVQAEKLLYRACPCLS